MPGSQKDEVAEESMDVMLKYNAKFQDRGYDIGSISSLPVAIMAKLLLTRVLRTCQNGGYSRQAKHVADVCAAGVRLN